jgi:hypothetical protein
LFHKFFDGCAARVDFLRALNPGLPIWALYGGPASEAPRARAAMSGRADHFSELPIGDSHWRWKNTDLSVRWWHRAVGTTLTFDVLHVVQWDLLLCAPLATLYPQPPDVVALTGLTRLDRIEHRWHWTLEDEASRGTAAQLAQVRSRYPHLGPARACLGPGYALPRAFLDAYVRADVSDAGHDEIRLPLWAEALGFPLSDTGFYPRWFDPEVERFVNADAAEIRPKDIRAELRKPDGLRAFHPCRESFTRAVLADLSETAAQRPPLVTALVATYQHVRWIREALRGVLAQEVDFPLEILVGDDCSTDGTREAVLEFAAEYPGRITTLLSPTNWGASGMPMFRELLRRARGRYIAILEGDDVWTAHDKLARQVALMERDPDIAVCFHDVDVIDLEGNLCPTTYVPARTPLRPAVTALCTTNFIPSCAAVVRAAALRGFADSVGDVIYGDWFAYLWAGQHGQLAFIPEVMGRYRFTGQGTWSSLNRETQLRRALELLRSVEEALPDFSRAALRAGRAKHRVELAKELFATGQLAPARLELLRALFEAGQRASSDASNWLDLFQTIFSTNASELHHRLLR